MCSNGGRHPREPPATFSCWTPLARGPLPVSPQAAPRAPDTAVPRYPGHVGGFVSIPEIILLVVVVLLVFGPKRVPEIGRQLGKGMREFKQSITGADDEVQGDTALPGPDD